MEGVFPLSAKKLNVRSVRCKICKNRVPTIPVKMSTTSENGLSLPTSALEEDGRGPR